MYVRLIYLAFAITFHSEDNGFSMQNASIAFCYILVVFLIETHALFIEREKYLMLKSRDKYSMLEE